MPPALALEDPARQWCSCPGRVLRKREAAEARLNVELRPCWGSYVQHQGTGWHRNTSPTWGTSCWSPKYPTQESPCHQKGSGAGPALGEGAEGLSAMKAWARGVYLERNRAANGTS